MLEVDRVLKKHNMKNIDIYDERGLDLLEPIQREAFEKKIKTVLEFINQNKMLLSDKAKKLLSHLSNRYKPSIENTDILNDLNEIFNTKLTRENIGLYVEDLLSERILRIFINVKDKNALKTYFNSATSLSNDERFIKRITR